MKNRNIMFWMVILFLISFSVIGLTYAYFLTRIEGNSNKTDITIVAGKLELTYFDGNNTIEINKIKPDTIVDTKTFSVKNTGTNIITNYGVYLENILNELEMPDDLDYTLTCKEKDSDGIFVRDCTGNNGDFPVNDSLLVSNSINVGYIHEYELVVKYVETGVDQSKDMNKKISGKIQIYDLNDIVDINGIVTNVVDGDYISLSNKTYKISADGSFYIPLIEAKDYILTIKSKDNLTKWQYSFMVTKDKNPSVDLINNMIIINDESSVVSMNITKGSNESIIINTISIDNE